MVKVIKTIKNGVEYVNEGFSPENTGTTGQVLTKTATGYQYENVPTELPSGGSAGNVLKKTSAGSEWGTIADATTSASGLMSSSDKTKLNGIDTSALSSIIRWLNDSPLASGTISKNNGQLITIPSGAKLILIHQELYSTQGSTVEQPKHWLISIAEGKIMDGYFAFFGNGNGSVSLQRYGSWSGSTYVVDKTRFWIQNTYNIGSDSGYKLHYRFY